MSQPKQQTSTDADEAAYQAWFKRPLKNPPPPAKGPLDDLIRDFAQLIAKAVQS